MFRLFKKTIAPPPDPLVPVLDFIKLFEQGKFKRALGFHKKHDHYLPETLALRQAIMGCGLVYGREWVDFIPKHMQYLMEPDNLMKLSAQELQTTLTGLIRLDHLGEGFVLSSCCQSGIVFAMLKRLECLHVQGEMAPLLKPAKH